jgi:DNA-binding XRE family transcriptional regulator
MMRFVCHTKHYTPKGVDQMPDGGKNRRVDVAAHFGRNLVRQRKRANLSQEELGLRASLHRTEIGHLERGERLARIDTLVKLADALSIPPGDLLAGIVWTPAVVTRGEFWVRAAEPEVGGQV